MAAGPRGGVRRAWPAGSRQIIAQVTRDGLLSAEDVVASYVAPGTPRAARPPHLRLARRGSRLSIRWGAAANATRGYQVVMIASDGRRQLFERSSPQRSVILTGFSSSGAKVTVEGVGPDGRTGAPEAAALKPIGPPARVTRLRIARHGVKGRADQLEGGRSRVSLPSLGDPDTREATGADPHPQADPQVRPKRSTTGVKVVCRPGGGSGCPKTTASLAAARPARTTKPKKRKH